MRPGDEAAASVADWPVQLAPVDLLVDTTELPFLQVWSSLSLRRLGQAHLRIVQFEVRDSIDQDPSEVLPEMAAPRAPVILLLPFASLTEPALLRGLVEALAEQLEDLVVRTAPEEEHWWPRADFANQGRFQAARGRMTDLVDSRIPEEDNPEAQTLAADTPPVTDNWLHLADTPSEAVETIAALDLR